MIGPEDAATVTLHYMEHPVSVDELDLDVLTARLAKILDDKARARLLAASKKDRGAVVEAVLRAAGARREIAPSKLTVFTSLTLGMAIPPGLAVTTAARLRVDDALSPIRERESAIAAAEQSADNDSHRQQLGREVEDALAKSPWLAEIAYLMADGLSHQEIADALGWKVREIRGASSELRRLLKRWQPPQPVDPASRRRALDQAVKLAIVAGQIAEPTAPASARALALVRHDVLALVAVQVASCGDDGIALFPGIRAQFVAFGLLDEFVSCVHSLSVDARVPPAMAGVLRELATVCGPVGEKKQAGILGSNEAIRDALRLTRSVADLIPKYRTRLTRAIATPKVRR